jgi:1-deoxy-D-xylulose-5-phosphate synthase
VIVVNDNARSYSPTIGGLAHHLATLRTTRGYEKFMNWGKRLLHRTPVVGEPVYGALHGMKKGVKDMVAPQGMFEDLGLKYIGPVDGHDEQEMEFALTRAKDFDGPVIVHAITHKGRGYGPAEDDKADHFHGVGVIDPDTGRPIKAGGPSWTGAFADEWSPSRPPCWGPPDSTGSPRPSPSAPTTSGSPSSMRSRAPQVWRTEGCTRSSPSTPPS